VYGVNAIIMEPDDYTHGFIVKLKSDTSIP